MLLGMQWVYIWYIVVFTENTTGTYQAHNGYILGTQGVYIRNTRGIY